MNAEVVAAQVKLYAKELKMPGLAAAFEEIVRDAAKAGRAPLEWLAACLAAEVASRAEHRLAARIKAARFPALKSFESFDFTLVPSLEKARAFLRTGTQGGASCRASACMTSGTRTPPWRCRPECIPRSSPSASGTPPSPSRWTLTATPSPPCRNRLPR